MKSQRIRLLQSSLALLLAARIVEAQTCEPCADEETPSDDEDCEFLISQTQTFISGTQACKLRQLENFQEGCCKESPRAVCTLCPDGASFDASKVIPAFDPNDGDTTCADLNGDEDFLDYIFEGGTCDDTLLQRSAAWCGCPTVERQCSLCPDGSKPPIPNLVDPVYYGWSCDAFDFVSSYFTADECESLVTDIYEFDAPSYCGCPNSPIPNVCDFCPDGEELIYPETRLGSGSFTCREVALSTKYIPVLSTCINVLTSYRDKGYMDECCGVPLWKRSSASNMSYSTGLVAAFLLKLLLS